MKLPHLLCIMLLALALAGCDGDRGPAGPAGPNGTDGTDWPGPPPQAYLDADGLAGGAAYSSWWTTAGGGSGTQPTTAAAADFYRCKACHAWDGLGNMGSYANRTGQSTGAASRPDVSAINLRSTVTSESYQELFDLVLHAGARDIDATDNAHPDFSAQLSDAQTWNIVKFMREEWVAPNLLYDLAVSGPPMHWDYSGGTAVLVMPTMTYTNIGALGNEANGQALFAANCAACHGATGTLIDIAGASVGEFVRSKPYEAWFKVKFGEPGTGMNPGLISATSDLQDLYAALADATNFPDLP